MGTSVHEGTIVQWLKEEGEPLKKGDALLLAESEKVEFEVESPYSGRLMKILVPADSSVPVGEALAVVETEDAVSADAQEAQGAASPPSPASSSSVPDRRAVPSEKGGPGTLLSPRVRRMAKDYGVALEEVAGIAGTGQGGRLTKSDFEAYLASRKGNGADLRGGVASSGGNRVLPQPENTDVVPLTPLRKRLARRLSASVHEIPQFTTFDEADVTEIVEYRKGKGESTFARKGIHLTYTHFLSWAALRAIEHIEFRSLNALFGGDVIYHFRNVHLGIAVAVPDGLLVPVIRGAEKLSFDELARQIQDLADQARQGTLSPEDVTGSTFTISNAGAAGSIYATPIINPPEAAILGVGTIRKRVVLLEDGSIGVRDRMGISLSVDHRMVDGMLAATFNRVVCKNMDTFDFSVLE
jgi:pyruvate/2-oxoglutarate dehydrogenase complex dihydrolipoamide acyltransferase (E2) component